MCSSIATTSYRVLGLISAGLMRVDTSQLFANGFVILVGLAIIYRGLTAKRFFRIRHGHRSDPRETVEPKWYNRLFLVAMGMWVAGFGVWHLISR
jgi:hypothetical protein